jgi:hypothetical protein
MSKFKVGDRVVIVNKETAFTRRRGEVVGFREDEAFPINVLMDGESGHTCFNETELEFEHIYDALSSPAPKVDSRLIDTPEVEGFDEWVDSMHEEVVNHPSHYTSHPSGIECIQVTEHMNFNLGNAVKYLWRSDLKAETPIEDLQKARWYIEREIQRLGGSVG